MRACGEPSLFVGRANKSQADNILEICNILNDLGGIYRRLKLYDDSIKVLEEAKKLNVDDAKVNYNLGFTYKFMGEYDDAVACFENVIQNNPNDVLAYNHLGSIFHSRGQIKSCKKL